MLKLTFHRQLKECNRVVTQGRRKLIYLLLPHSCADLPIPSFVKCFHELIKKKKKITNLKKIYFLRLGNPSDNLGVLSLESAHGENQLPDANCRSSTLSISLSAFTSLTHFVTVILTSMAKKILIHVVSALSLYFLNMSISSQNLPQCTLRFLKYSKITYQEKTGSYVTFIIYESITKKQKLHTNYKHEVFQSHLKQLKFTQAQLKLGHIFLRE